ncbi:unnamed protein product [Parascedosporium putredinis]|uniref:Uncharacterized protein n=1 Tax=Parascedosporium putredinis TaxID=1442378 RepID=A0A9P1H979_9PEZI|nr:unnamed protein product [Parascedosporium putredinis]CAI8001414.1 unnamed protein product [Parascedosporium putredinis]
MAFGREAQTEGLVLQRAYSHTQVVGREGSFNAGGGQVLSPQCARKGGLAATSLPEKEAINEAPELDRYDIEAEKALLSTHLESGVSKSPTIAIPSRESALSQIEHLTKLKHCLLESLAKGDVKKTEGERRSSHPSQEWDEELYTPANSTVGSPIPRGEGGISLSAVLDEESSTPRPKKGDTHQVQAATPKFITNPFETPGPSRNLEDDLEDLCDDNYALSPSTTPYVPCGPAVTLNPFVLGSPLESSMARRTRLSCPDLADIDSDDDYLYMGRRALKGDDDDLSMSARNRMDVPVPRSQSLDSGYPGVAFHTGPVGYLNGSPITIPMVRDPDLLETLVGGHVNGTAEENFQAQGQP